ncbi:Dak1 domain-containing protein [Russula aff. rugulosa BPL654]|nr:Dak1 domain-containing protein [Russula aff. rugulosa BPL654]
MQALWVRLSLPSYLLSLTRCSIGRGMLSAAVCGNIFASPGPTQVRRAIELVDNDKGTLIIVKNYTGDVLNFGLAREKFAAQHPSKVDKVKFLVVGDDVAVDKTQGSIVGRRGLAGTVLVYKIAGALAEAGANLNVVYSVAKWASQNIATIGVGLEHCHVPGTTVGDAYLTSSEIEIGMGIHNEAGFKRISPSDERGFLLTQGSGKDRVVLLVNNLGGVSELELAGIAREATTALSARHFFASLSATHPDVTQTSLNMPGFSLTLLLLPSSGSPTVPTIADPPPEEVILSLLDVSPDAPGWKWTSHVPHLNLPHHRPLSQPNDADEFTHAVERACNALDRAEPEITRMDTISGDGDCGLTLRTGARAVLAHLRAGSISGEDVIGALIAVSEVAAEKMGGTSGALYSIFFSALARALTVTASSAGVVAVQDWSRAISTARERLYTYTRARPPSRTLIDPLVAFVDAFSANPSDLRAAVTKAAVAAEATRDTEARVGRSAYVDAERLKQERVPDPGAWGVKVILEALAAIGTA